ncbi:hypothetical protein BC826DRAFT_916943 [Russula brevipes]|nr:hypothetical protein BC826DRAFT_916943 [Russula brevipes]
MSASKKEAEQSILNFTAIFEEALGEYKRLTKEDLANHPLAKQLDDCMTPNSVLSLIRKQATKFDEFKSGNDKLMKWVNPIVHTLSACSSVLGDGLGLPFPPAKMIFTGIRVLLGAVKDTSASYDTLVDLFRRIGNSLQRLNILTKLPLTPEMITLLGNTMAEVLEILALSSREKDQNKFKAYFKALLGKKEVKEALERLDGLTQEEVQMIMARNLEITHSIKDGEQRRCDWGKAYDDLEKWLSPPNPSKNHNDALTVVYKENAEWFIQDDRYIEWKKNGSLLWISGSIGSGKSVLCSTIVEDIKTIQNSTSVLISYYYFDFKDIEKRDVCGLLSSILFQLAEQSEHCWTILSQLYASHKKSVRPSERALKECLQDMLELPEQAAIYVIVDALDECPDATTPSRREPVLKFLESLVELRYSNLRVCVTSRPEPDIRSALNPLTPTSCRVSLDDEDGQREDIRNYIRSFVESDLNMKKWRMGIKELVIKTLSDQSGGM